MTIWSILGWLLHWLPLQEWGDAMLRRHEAVKKAKEIANAPITDSDWIRKARDGDL